ncbi:ABC transporter permease [Paenirhodobacter populi]|uniref:ABC transporter permease n=1 Tax=Paenirhodobacter populi TaxID=2306993 RepID=A0A443ISP4_9RHOB|nr:ABC transporter permease [Sinirhodobacter populi]RWR06214.1 ABC transporter permease [Sinirhodobacter populi]RWR10957.1 ABC transporter permease [Sinirhodobacter populi]RWR16097.1 ABC transporter permease [Sinirhodobacter populi]RWR26346.1 ABC transporter permease [Sinirhodobacter populi]
MNILVVLRRRLMFLVLVIFGVSLITFTISHMIPGDPARLLAGDRASDELVAQMRENLGLDQPLYVQYGRYIAGLVQGDLGTSIRTGRPVLEDIVAYFPATLELVIVALIFSILVGVPLGVASAVWRNGIIDQLARTFAAIGISTPAFWLGLLLLVAFYGRLGWFPGSGRLDAGIAPPPTITGMYVFDSLVTGQFKTMINAIWHLVLPALCLGFVHVGVIARQIRSAMLDQLSEDYVRTARASGLSKARVILIHALPNAAIPSVTVLGLAFGDLLYGAVLTETIFAWPGMGAYVVNSIQALDFPAVMGFTVIVSMAYVLVNLAVDLAYIALDPRIKEVG